MTGCFEAGEGCASKRTLFDRALIQLHSAITLSQSDSSRSGSEMEAILAVVVLAVVFSLAGYILENYWHIFFLIGLAIGAFSLLSHLMDEKRKKDAERKSEIERQERVEREQRETREREEKERTNALLRRRLAAQNLVKQLPILLTKAEGQLEEALVDFNERAFYPFWDNLEASAISLKEFGDLIDRIKDCATEYSALLLGTDGPRPSFPVTGSLVPHLAAYEQTLAKVKRLARTAHRNFEFSSIYATRKTNTILVQGFATLAQALDNISYQINSGTERLSDALSSLELSLGYKLESIADALDTASEQASNQEYLAKFQRQKIVNSNSDILSAQRTAIEMLDNIQRGKKPLPGL